MQRTDHRLCVDCGSYCGQRSVSSTRKKSVSQLEISNMQSPVAKVDDGPVIHLVPGIVWISARVSSILPRIMHRLCLTEAQILP